MTDTAKPERPVGYHTPTIRRRVTRPLHARRAAILEQAEAAFRPRAETEKSEKPNECQTKSFA